MTLDDQMARLSVSQPLILDATTEQINTGEADLFLNGGVTINTGGLSSSGGTISALGLSLGEGGTLNIQGGNLKLSAGGTAVSGATLVTSDTTISLAGTFEVEDTWNSSNTNLSLIADAELSSAAAIELNTLQTNGFNFILSSETTDLTIEDSLIIDSGSNGGIDTGCADLTMNGPVTVSSGGITSSGGTLTFGNNSGSTSVSYTHLTLPTKRIV